MSVNLPQNVCPGFFFPHVKGNFSVGLIQAIFFLIFASCIKMKLCLFIKKKKKEVMLLLKEVFSPVEFTGENSQEENFSLKMYTRLFS